MYGISPLYSQCIPPQLDPDCDACLNWTKINITVCVTSTLSYNATIEICTQYAVPPNPIDNPCTPNCNRAIDAITWVRSICVDQDLKDLGEPALLQAIIRGTNLCCPAGNFLNVMIPACTAEYGCETSPAAFCHILAMPRCMNKNYETGCYDKCLDCKDFCMVERRYCRPTPTTCCKHYNTTCSYREDAESCNAMCNKTWDCDLWYFKGNSNVCCN